MKWLLILLVVWGAWMLLRPKPKRSPKLDAALIRDVAEARAVLGVPGDADADAIRAAHRRVLAAVHPDRGGSSESAGRANAARDLLLKVRN